MKFDSLGDRMKKNYEEPYQIKLPRRMPLIIRVDGKNFHTLTRGSEKPFDARLIDAMQLTAIKLVKETGGCVFAYQQSDEISLLLHNYKRLGSMPWYDNELQKIVSVSASIAAVKFTEIWGKEAHFDSRAFVIPEAEVANYFVWRQKDAERNSLSMLAQAHYSSKQLHLKKASDMHDMLHEKGVNWNDLPTHIKRGTGVVRNDEYGPKLDFEIPIFTQNREYIEDLLMTEEKAIDLLMSATFK